jgi:hypothetical protein
MEILLRVAEQFPVAILVLIALYKGVTAVRGLQSDWQGVVREMQQEWQKCTTEQNAALSVEIQALSRQIQVLAAILLAQERHNSETEKSDTMRRAERYIKAMGEGGGV